LADSAQEKLANLCADFAREIDLEAAIISDLENKLGSHKTKLAQLQKTHTALVPVFKGLGG